MAGVWKGPGSGQALCVPLAGVPGSWSARWSASSGTREGPGSDPAPCMLLAGVSGSHKVVTQDLGGPVQFNLKPIKCKEILMPLS